MANFDGTGNGCDGYVSDVSVISNTTRGTNDVSTPVLHRLNMLTQTPRKRKNIGSCSDADFSPIIPSQNISSGIQRRNNLVQMNTLSEGCTSDSESAISESILTNTDPRKSSVGICESPVSVVGEARSRSICSKQDAELSVRVPADPGLSHGCQVHGTLEGETQPESTLVQNDNQTGHHSRSSYNPAHILEELFDSDPSNKKFGRENRDDKIAGPYCPVIHTLEYGNSITSDSDSTRPASGSSQQFDLTQTHDETNLQNVSKTVVVNNIYATVPPTCNNCLLPEIDMTHDKMVTDTQSSQMFLKEHDGSDPQEGRQHRKKEQLSCRHKITTLQNMDKDTNAISSEVVTSSGSGMSSSLGDDRVKNLLCGSQVSEVTTASSDLLLDIRCGNRNGQSGLTTDVCNLNHIDKNLKTSAISVLCPEGQKDKSSQSNVETSFISSHVTLQSSEESQLFFYKERKTECDKSRLDTSFLSKPSVPVPQSDCKELEFVGDIMPSSKFSDTYIDQSAKIIIPGNPESTSVDKDKPLFNNKTPAEAAVDKDCSSTDIGQEMDLSRNPDQVVSYIDMIQKKQSVSDQASSVIHQGTNISQTDGDISTQLLDFIVEFSQVSKASSVKSLEDTSHLKLSTNTVSSQRHFSCFGDDKENGNYAKESKESFSSANRVFPLSFSSQTACRQAVCDEEDRQRTPVSHTPLYNTTQGKNGTGLCANQKKRDNSEDASLQCGQNTSGKLTWKEIQPAGDEGRRHSSQEKTASATQEPNTQCENGPTNVNSKNIMLAPKPKQMFLSMSERNILINLKTRYKEMTRILKQNPDRSILADLLTELKEIQVTISRINEEHKSERTKMSARVTQKNLPRSQKKQLKIELQELGTRQKQLVEVVHRHKEINNIVKHMIAEAEETVSKTESDRGVKREVSKREVVKGFDLSSKDNANNRNELRENQSEENGTQHCEAITSTACRKEMIDAESVVGRNKGEMFATHDVQSVFNEKRCGLHGNESGDVLQGKKEKCSGDVDSMRCGERKQNDSNNRTEPLENRKYTHTAVDEELKHEQVSSMCVASHGAANCACKESTNVTSTPSHIQETKPINGALIKSSGMFVCEDKKNWDECLLATQITSIEDSQQDLFSQESSKSGCDMDRRVLDDIIRTHCNQAGDRDDEGVAEIVTTTDTDKKNSLDLSVKKSTGNTNSYNWTHPVIHLGVLQDESNCKNSFNEMVTDHMKLGKRKNTELDDEMGPGFVETGVRKTKRYAEESLQVEDTADPVALVSQEGAGHQSRDRAYSLAQIDTGTTDFKTQCVVYTEGAVLNNFSDHKDKSVSITSKQPVKDQESQLHTFSTKSETIVRNKAVGNKKKGFVPSKMKILRKRREETPPKPMTCSLDGKRNLNKYPMKAVAAASPKLIDGSKAELSLTAQKANYVLPTTINKEVTNCQPNQRETTHDISQSHSQHESILLSPNMEICQKNTSDNLLMSPPSMMSPLHKGRQTVTTPPEKSSFLHAMMSPCTTAASSDVFPVTCRELARRMEQREAREKSRTEMTRKEEYVAIPVGRIEDFDKQMSSGDISEEMKHMLREASFVQPLIPPVVKPVAGNKKTDLMTLLETGVLQPGKDVLSVETGNKTFQASLNDKGHIVGSGGETFCTPTIWFQAVTGNIGVKKTQAYNKVLYKGKPLSKFELPNTANKTSDTGRPGNLAGVSMPSLNQGIPSNASITHNTGPSVKSHPSMEVSTEIAIPWSRWKRRDGSSKANHDHSSVSNLLKVLSHCTIKLIDDAEIVACPEIDRNFWMTEFKDLCMSDSLWDSVNSWH